MIAIAGATCREQTAMPMEKPKRRRQSSDADNANKRWKGTAELDLARMINRPGWNVHVVARHFGRSAKAIYERAARLDKEGKIDNMLSWSAIMSMVDPNLVPPPEPPVAGPTDVPCALCGAPTSDITFVESAGKRYHVDCHLRRPGVPTPILGVRGTRLGVINRATFDVLDDGCVGLALGFDFHEGGECGTVLPFTYTDRATGAVVTRSHMGATLAAILGAVGVERLVDLVGRVVIVERNTRGDPVAFEAPSFVPHIGRYDRRAFLDSQVTA